MIERPDGKSSELARRTFLRGCGAAMALPLLEIMQPSLARAAAATGASAKPPVRTAFFYIPNGVVQSAWHPKETGPDYTLSPTLEPLAPVRKKIALFTKLDRIKVSGTDGHAQAGACWLSSAAPDELSPAGYPLKRTIDQIMAAETGKHTPFRSLELSCNSYQDNKESVYFDNISWYGHGHVARSMRDPKLVFDRLFKIDQHASSKSLLDLVREDAKSLHRELGRNDRRKLDEYQDSVRAIETQIERVRSRQGAIKELGLEAPATVYTAMRRDDYIQLMGDLMILALRTDLTRVSSMMVAPERWSTPQFVHGVFDKPILHHSLTHGQGNESIRKQLEKLDRFHVEQFTRLVEKMDAIDEGESTLLDNSMFLLGSGLSSGQLHVCNDLPTVIAGTAGGALKTNRHERFAEGTPIANLWVSMANTMGVKAERIGDSTGALARFGA